MAKATPKTTATPAQRKPAPDPSSVGWYMHRSDFRWVTISSPTGIDVYPNVFPVCPQPPSNPQVIGVCASAPLLPGKRVVIAFKASPESESVWRLAKETPTHLYVTAPDGKPFPPVEKASLHHVHAVVAVYTREPDMEARS